MRRKLLFLAVFLCGIFFSARAQVAPEIIVLTPDPCVPGKVSLQVTNCSSCVSYDWEIGSGTGFKAGGDNYSTIVTNPGWYDVTVIVKTSAGGKLAVSKKKAFFGHGEPNTGFLANKISFCSGRDTLVVTDTTRNSVTRDWLIDGKVYYNGGKTIKQPLNGTPGYKSVYLLVRDSWNCKGSVLRDSLISVWDSIKVNFNPTSTQGCAPKYISFNPQYDTTKQTIKSVSWSFQGGAPATSTLRNPANIYYAKGDTLDVRMTLKTKQGCAYNYWANNIISMGDTALMSISAPKSKFCVNEKVLLTVTGNKVIPNWTISGVNFASDSTKGKKITVWFTDTGSATFTVTTSDRGCVSSATYKGVAVLGPKALFVSEYPFFCAVPKKLVFTNKSIEDPGGTTWKWGLYEQNTSLISSGTSKDFSYTTNNKYSYGVKLVATGNNGCKDSAWMPFASIYGKIDTNFMVVPDPVCPGQKVMLISKAGPGTKTSPNFFTWTFFDSAGNVAKVDNAEKGSFTYFRIGDYSAKLVIWNNEGCKDSLKLKDTIHVISPTANIGIKDTLVCMGEQVTVYAWGKGVGKFVQQWQMHNIDSICDDVYGQKDTLNFYLRKTGRWRVKYTLTDTSAGSCYKEIIYPYYIKVSGIYYTISGDPTYGCVPLTSNLQAKLGFNVNYKVPSNAVNFLWKTDLPRKVFFGDSTKQNTSATVAAGTHNVHLVFSNASGCKDSSLNLALTSGIFVGFEIPTTTYCVGTSAKIHNISSGWVQSWEYSCDSPSVQFTPSKSVYEPNIKFTKDGLFKIKLKGTYNNACSDSSEILVRIYTMKAEFSTPDTISYCAPRLVNFTNSSTGALYNQWFFGDGDSSNTIMNDLAGHLYQKNNKKGYDVKLITENAYGCRDTLVKKNYVKVIGPIPDFDVKNISGCEPLHVKFINNSQDYNKMYMDYDNGVVLDSSQLQDYVYKVYDKSLKVQKFVPRILLYDSLGCAALGTSKDTISVLKSAEAKYSFSSTDFLRKTEGCANNLQVKFSNLSKYYVTTYWDFDDDWKTDAMNQNNPSWFYTQPGVFHPSIVAVHINGCRDTFRADSIVVWDPPVADFTPSADSICAINPVKFYSNTKSTYPIAKYKWNFGELPIYIDTSSQTNPTWKYITPFDHLATLNVEDIHGCTSQKIKDIYVFDTAGPAKPELAYITVRNNNFVDCYWRISTLGNFWQYHVYLDSITYWEKFSSYNRQDTSLSWKYGNKVMNQRFCFTVNIEDSCHQMGRYGISHCTMVLRDTLFEPYNAQLNWLSYDWWGAELSHYEIFRKDPGSGSFTKIADVKSNRQTYTDSFLCDQTYEYYVEAVNKNGTYRSRSNSILVKPIYVKPQYSVNTTLVTVDNNAYTRINWEPYPKYFRKYSYVLERSYNGLPGSFVQIDELQALTDNDMNADVQNRSNYYRVLFKDHCGEKSAPGTVSNSILLRTVQQNRNSSSVLWNPYGFWYSGVREYGVQLRDPSGKFNTYKTVGPSVSEVDSIDIDKLNLDSICFRVYAVKDTITNDTSFSNIVCLVPSSYILVPNSFTPDQNGLNEVFKPVAGFIHRRSDKPEERFEFRIFNRWGQEVFLSNDADLGWDGMFQKQQCMPGLYIYTIKALGYDGIPHLLKGTVMLLR